MQTRYLHLVKDFSKPISKCVRIQDGGIIVTFENTSSMWLLAYALDISNTRFGVRKLTMDETAKYISERTEFLDYSI